MIVLLFSVSSLLDFFSRTQAVFTVVCGVRIVLTAGSCCGRSPRPTRFPNGEVGHVDYR